jgi:hypothetical protein
MGKRAITQVLEAVRLVEERGHAYPLHALTAHVSDWALAGLSLLGMAAAGDAGRLSRTGHSLAASTSFTTTDPSSPVARTDRKLRAADAAIRGTRYHPLVTTASALALPPDIEASLCQPLILVACAGASS